MKWRDDKKWSDRFLHEIKGIIGQAFIVEPPQEEDSEHNTDLIVLKLDSIRIACRIRKYKYMKSYGSEFTIRCGRPSGAKTELTKIIEGWGDFLFYGFSDEEEKHLAGWSLIILGEFRLWFNRMIVKNKGTLPGRQKSNEDNSSTFMVFDLRDMKEVIHSQSSTLKYYRYGDASEDTAYSDNLP